MSDPFPQVAGQGTVTLRAAGVAVDVGLCEAEAQRLNAPYLTLLGLCRPYVHLKWAMTLDGKIATRTGDSQWISNEACRRRVHELRGRMDGILVGVGTVLADDPLLTARPSGPRTATRIILDSRLRTPSTAQLVLTAAEAPVLLVTGSEAGEERAAALRGLGCEVLRLPGQRLAVTDLLAELGQRRLTNLLVEGGSEVLGSFRDAGAADEVHVFVAPRLVGGAGAKGPAGGAGVERIAEALHIAECTAVLIDDNVYLHGRRSTGLPGARGAV
jgi:diaminohydroxyphosphoribosylaminopyrimidine deaminase/5-amino-6-(5-phosphoribosylamino)uracil reductase